MITIILQSSLCWLVFLLVYQLFLRKETFFRFNRYYLLVTLLLGVLVPVLRMIWEIIYPDPFQFQTFASFQGTAQVLELPSVSGLDKIDWLLWLNRMYWTGVLVFLLVLMKQIMTIIKTIQSNPKQKLEGYTLVNTDYAHLPFSFMGYVFISNQVEFKDEELNRILKHESSHVHGGHSMDVILIELIKCLAWFSPLVYWYKNSIRNTHEYLADALVLKSTDTQSYGQLLIHNSQQGLQMALVNHFIYSQLKNRINMMIKSPSRPLNVWKYTLIIPILFLLGVMFAYKSDTANSNDSKAPLSIRAKDSLPVNVLYILNGEKSTEDEIKNVYPQQITSMNVIKDKEAIKQYGEEGKNGIIQINTRTLYLIDEIESSKEAVDKINPDDIATMDVVKYGKSSTGVIKIRLKESSSKEKLNLVSDGVRVKVGDHILRSDQFETDRNNGQIRITDKKVLSSAEQVTVFYDKDNLKLANNDSIIEPLRFAQQMPQFPGPENALIIYLSKNIQYPKGAKEAKVQGKIILDFLVRTDGSIENVKVLRGIGAGCDEEAVRVMHKMNSDGIRWKPGINNGKEVPVVVTLPISFKLGDEKTNIPADLKSTNPANSQINSPGKGEQKIFTEVDELPRFPGCESVQGVAERSNCSNLKLLEYVSAHLKYPLQAHDAGIQGKVLVSFVINPDGSVSMAKVVKDIGGGCAASALEMVNEMNKMNVKWIPGKSHGKFVAVEYVLPLTFNLIGVDKNVSKAKMVPKANPLTQENKLKVIPNPASHQVEINWT
ncbi:MAG: M56 family metallopeptidase, partial [Saprospiraceae bacterium]